MNEYAAFVTLVRMFAAATATALLIWAVLALIVWGWVL